MAGKQDPQREPSRSEQMVADARAQADCYEQIAVLTEAFESSKASWLADRSDPDATAAYEQARDEVVAFRSALRALDPRRQVGVQADGDGVTVGAPVATISGEGA